MAPAASTDQPPRTTGEDGEDDGDAGHDLPETRPCGAADDACGQ
jgi:hypothetical protein